MMDNITISDCIEDIFRHPVEVDVLGRADCLDHGDVVASDAIMHEFLVYSFCLRVYRKALLC